MKTKEEVIKEAWGVNYDKFKSEIDSYGWLSLDYEYRLIEDIEDVEKLEHGDDTNYNNPYSHFRPKSLQGLEDNQGWIRIESEGDLPKEDGIYWVYTIDCNGQLREKEDFLIRGKLNRYFTHYQPIIKPKKPLY